MKESDSGFKPASRKGPRTRRPPRTRDTSAWLSSRTRGGSAAGRERKAMEPGPTGRLRVWCDVTIDLLPWAPPPLTWGLAELAPVFVQGGRTSPERSTRPLKRPRTGASVCGGEIPVLQRRACVRRGNDQRGRCATYDRSNQKHT